MSGHGELWGRRWSWWRRQPRVQVDPHTVVLAGTPVDERAVARYRDDPEWRPWFGFGGNEPCVERTRDGRLVMQDGKHRTLAAREAGRMLTVRLADAREHAR